MRDGVPYPIHDDAPVLRFFSQQWQVFHASGDLPALVGAVLLNDELWGRDLTQIDGLAGAVTADLQAILSEGARDAAESVLK
jgi:tagaturonate reductase